MVCAAIVQARVGSSRLPGKVLEHLGGASVLEHVLRRAAKVPGIDIVVCAIPDKPESAPLATIATQCGARVFRGDEKDVLSRYAGAARDVDAQVVLRITSDCPLIDWEVAGRVLAARAEAAVDYAANNMPRTFPHGLDCEVFTTEALAEAASKATEAYDREHVTPWIRRAPHLNRVNVASEREAESNLRWTLDHPEDLTFFRAVFEHFMPGQLPTTREVMDVLARYPDIAVLNRHLNVA